MARYRQPERLTRTISCSDDYVDLKPVNEQPSDKMDPNLGLIASMPKVDQEDRSDLQRRWRNLTKLKPGLSEVNELDNESTPAVLIFGGINTARPTDYLNSASMFLYHLDRNNWNFYGTMLEPRNYHAAAYFHGKVYLFGGYNPLHCIKGKMQATSTTFQLTLDVKQWRRRADMPSARAHHGVTIMDERIFVFGGKDSNGNIIASVEMYEPELDQWTSLASIPEPLMGSAVTNNEGLIYVVGGLTTKKEKNQEGVLSNKIYCFDPLNNKWYRKPPLPCPRAFASATTQNKKIWIWGGASLSEGGTLASTTSVDIWDPKKGRFEQHLIFDSPKHCLAVTKAGTQVFIIGGMSSKENSSLAEVQVYDRKRDILQKCAFLPVSLTGTAAVGIPVNRSPASDITTSKTTRSGSRKTQKTLKDKQQSDIHARNKAARTIQLNYRKYHASKQRRSGIPRDALRKKINVGEGDRVSGRIRTYITGYRPKAPGDDDLSKDFAPVTIPFWPPDPDTSDSVFHTVVDQFHCAKEKMQFKHFYTIPRQIDPNLGMLLFMDEDYQHSKKVLGLRNVESTPYYMSRFHATGDIQDTSIPVIIAIGGVDPQDPMNVSYGRSVFQYHPLKDRWEFFGFMSLPRNHHAAAYYRGAIYVTGGCDPHIRCWGEMVATKMTFVYRLSSNKWTRVADMHSARSHHSMVVFNDSIYVIGGRDDSGRLSASVESYVPALDEWNQEKPMPLPRMGMAVVSHGGYLWVMGGVTSTKGGNINPPVLDDVICYDPVFKHWVSGKPLRIARAFGSAVVCDDKIWLCGGAAPSQDENNYLVSIPAIDVYDNEALEWIQKATLSCPRHSSVVVALESCLYLIGGINSHELSAINRNELYTTDSDTVQSIRELPVQLTGMAAVTIPPTCVTFRSESLSIMIRHKVVT
uniref:Beta-scruin n=1 Tax=Limulus polyphemus TaxID=6850 RepID=SCRB_LIMPO|nr:RecName: Full=Beta-scruin [Limulus polyphemus]CAA87589.1 beta scruin [Limulus polyphemus]